MRLCFLHWHPQAPPETGALSQKPRKTLTTLELAANQAQTYSITSHLECLSLKHGGDGILDRGHRCVQESLSSPWAEETPQDMPSSSSCGKEALKEEARPNSHPPWGALAPSSSPTLSSGVSYSHPQQSIN